MLKELLKGLRLYKPLVTLKKGVEDILQNLQEKKNVRARVKFYSGFLQASDLVFDVGANVGNRVHSFRAIGCRVVAVEPQPECYEILEKKFGDTIEVVKMGLGEREEEKTMFVANESTISSLSEEWIQSVKQDRFKNHNWDKQIIIKITTLDNLIRKYGKPVFCKIDVEGYELEVLKGLTQPIPRMSVEYTVPEQTNRLIQCIEYCLQLNPAYKFNYCTGESMNYKLKEAVNGEKFLQLVREKEFQASVFGDIYVIQ
jgi:FkbM family methyltransferase